MATRTPTSGGPAGCGWAGGDCHTNANSRSRCLPHGSTGMLDIPDARHCQLAPKRYRRFAPETVPVDPSLSALVWWTAFFPESLPTSAPWRINWRWTSPLQSTTYEPPATPSGGSLRRSVSRAEPFDAICSAPSQTVPRRQRLPSSRRQPAGKFPTVPRRQPGPAMNGLPPRRSLHRLPQAVSATRFVKSSSPNANSAYAIALPNPKPLREPASPTGFIGVLRFRRVRMSVGASAVETRIWGLTQARGSAWGLPVVSV